MLELGKAGFVGTKRGVRPVLRDGVVVATLRASSWKEAATAVIGDREWVFAKNRRELGARWATEPDGVMRLRARRTSFWKGTWELDLEGASFERVSTSIWSGRPVYVRGGDQVARGRWAGWWSPRPVLHADDSIPLHHQVFLLWLELVLSRRNTAAATAGTTAAVIGGTG